MRSDPHTPVLPLPEPPLSDGVVALRAWRDDDAGAKAAWGEDAEIVRWTSVPAGYSEAAARSQALANERARREGRMLRLAIVDASSGELLGACEIGRPDPADAFLGQVGYLLAAHARGRGAATRALRLLLDWGFRVLGLGRVQALVHPDNGASIRVLERLGFRRDSAAGEPVTDASRLVFRVAAAELVPPSATA